MAAKIQIRRDTAANWTSNNPTLSNGEMGYETDTNKLKFGNGSDNWTTLGYFGATVDLSAYATESDTQLWVNSQGFLTAHQDISGKADAGVSYTKAETDALIPSVPTATSELTNDSGFLTAHQDISGKSDTGHTHQTFEILGLNSSLSSKAEATSVYTKTESDALYATTSYVDGQVFSGMMKDVGDNITDLGNVSGTISMDYNSGTQFKLTASGNLTFSGVSNMSSGDSVVLDITQDGTGNRTWTDTVSAKYLGGDSTLSTAAGDEDTVLIRYDGSNYKISVGKGWS